MTPPVDGVELTILDSHHHLVPDGEQPYGPGAFREDAATDHRVVGSVYVELTSRWRRDGPQILRPLGEIEFAEGVGRDAAARSGSHRTAGIHTAAAIVGYADLSTGKVSDLLDRCLAASPERFRGVRQSVFDLAELRGQRHPFERVDPEPFTTPSFLRGLGQVAERGLVFDAAVVADQVDNVARIAHLFPDLTVVLDHMAPPVLIGIPPKERRTALDRWRDGLARVAEHPNVMCKIGGLGMRLWGLDGLYAEAHGDAAALAEAWRPLVVPAVEAFGADRCMMESNFPVDRRSVDYATLWRALELTVEDASPDEVRALFHRTASRVYRIDL